ncbi:hypothetical protein SAMN05192561_1125 [Halopenitus malekzadehii]|uniref:Uncharacterized protein n=1 Tax=Halopenitus malekzadehii TaxID=1267564 RepID=A0A1H6JN72_9EURY|nr:hypothetical protein [Halopenitus malekzadehii]SEH60473.1 hypothetical protein SAMN05192561_1125 [Halopenitus malekzadehii]
MTVSPVTIDVSAQTGALPQETFTDVAVIGTATAAPPDAAFDEVNQYQSASEVANDYGDGSDVHVASQALAEMGASSWYVQVLEQTEVVDEDVDDGTTVANTPVHGEAGVTASNRDVVYSTEEPPAQPDNGEVAINTATGEVTTDDGTTATLTYSYVDWSTLEELEYKGINRAHLADTRAGREHIGDYDEFVSWASAAQVGVPLPIEDPSSYADDETAMTAAHEIAGYVPGGHVLGVTAKTSADIGAYKLGQMAVNDPWLDPYFDGEGYPYAIDSIPGRLIGDPGDTGTFVGGDADGNGPVNVVVSVSGVNVLWRSVSTAGAASDYQWFDVQMTEYFATSLIENSLTSLALNRDKIPFTGDGQSMIESTIVDTLVQYTGGPDDPFAETDIYVPEPEDLPEDDRANKRWTGIELEYRLSGSAQTFTVDLTVTV